MTSKACSKCTETKPLDAFHRSAKAKDGRASWCSACVNGIARETRKRKYSKEDRRKWQLNTRYRLTPDDVATMIANQNGACALCPAVLTRPCIDHCHVTGKVRGVLCHRCNIRLGGWDDLEWRAKAIKYLGIEPPP